MTNMTRVWLGADGEYIGSTGTNSVRDLAEAIAANDDHDVVLEALFEHERGIDIRLASAGDLTGFIEQRLNEVGVKAIRVPASAFSDDYWTNTIPCELDARPRSGFIKSVGVSL